MRKHERAMWRRQASGIRRTLVARHGSARMSGLRPAFLCTFMLLIVVSRLMSNTSWVVSTASHLLSRSNCALDVSHSSASALLPSQENGGMLFCSSHEVQLESARQLVPTIIKRCRHNHHTSGVVSSRPSTPCSSIASSVEHIV
jgi:hypothetical protein